jgi:hypothetical protein
MPEANSRLPTAPRGHRSVATRDKEAKEFMLRIVLARERRARGSGGSRKSAAFFFLRPAKQARFDLPSSRRRSPATRHDSGLGHPSSATRQSRYVTVATLRGSCPRDPESRAHSRDLGSIWLAERSGLYTAHVSDSPGGTPPCDCIGVFSSASRFCAWVCSAAAAGC